MYLSKAEQILTVYADNPGKFSIPTKSRQIVSSPYFPTILT